MYNEHNWLDIHNQLYPMTLMSKQLYLQNQSAGVPIQVTVNVIYDSYNREINITETVNEVISAYCNGDGEYKLYIFNYEMEKYQNLGNYPLKEPILLRESFVQIQFIRIKVQDLARIDENIINGQGQEITKKTEKSIRDILKIVAQWRKLYLLKQKKITLEEAANQIDDYYWQIKTAQKYGFEFETNLDKPFKLMKKFVQQKNEKKKDTLGPVLTILEKYHPK